MKGAVNKKAAPSANRALALEDLCYAAAAHEVRLLPRICKRS